MREVKKGRVKGDGDAKSGADPPPTASVFSLQINQMQIANFPRLRALAEECFPNGAFTRKFMDKYQENKRTIGSRSSLFQPWLGFGGAAGRILSSTSKSPSYGTSGQRVRPETSYWQRERN